MAHNRPDRRTQRMRAALVQAFTSLLLEPRNYEQITVRDIVERANAGRSTFYEHYKNKDAILAESIQRPFSQLVCSVDIGSDPAALAQVLEHFWQNRSQTRGILGGTTRRAVSRILADMIQARLLARPKAPGRDLRRVKLTAIALAEAQLGTISAWLNSELACSATLVAEVLHGLSQSAAAALGNAA
jgi:AcrR family transcriptional regulator